jgi:hypothetical protein
MKEIEEKDAEMIKQLHEIAEKHMISSDRDLVDRIEKEWADLYDTDQQSVRLSYGRLVGRLECQSDAITAVAIRIFTDEIKDMFKNHERMRRFAYRCTES